MNGVIYKNVFCFVFLVVIPNFIDAQYTIKIFRYGYSQDEQPFWKQKFPACGGDLQSPISIFNEIVQEADLPDLEMVGYHTGLKAVSWIYNDGYSVRRRIPDNYDDKPFVFTRNGDAYDIVEFHFHWGSVNSRGAEHIINDIHYPMEMHIVHKRRTKRDVFHSDDDAQGFVVLAFFFQIRNIGNPGIQQFVDALQYVRNPNTSYWDRKPFTLASMIHGVDLETYYTYNGSFTTPPCYESVRWYLFPDPIAITEEQLGEFRKLRGWNRPLVDNYRLTQQNKGYCVKLKLPRKKLINEENPEASMPVLEFLTPKEEDKLRRGGGGELISYLQMPFSRALVAKYSYHSAEDPNIGLNDDKDDHLLDHIDTRANTNKTDNSSATNHQRHRRDIKLPAHIKSIVEHASEAQIKDALGKLTDSFIAIKKKKSSKREETKETALELRSATNDKSNETVSKDNQKDTSNSTKGAAPDKGSRKLFDALKDVLQSAHEAGKSPAPAAKDPHSGIQGKSGRRRFGRRSGRFGFGFGRYGRTGYRRFGLGPLWGPVMHHY